MVVRGKHVEAEDILGAVEIPHELDGQPAIDKHCFGGVVESGKIHTAVEEVRVRHWDRVDQEHVRKVVIAEADRGGSKEEVLGRFLHLRDDNAPRVLVKAGAGEAKTHCRNFVGRELGEDGLAGDPTVDVRGRGLLSGSGAVVNRQWDVGGDIRCGADLEKNLAQRINRGGVIVAIVVNGVWGGYQIRCKGEDAGLEGGHKLAKALLVPVEGQLDTVVHRAEVLGDPEGPTTTTRNGSFKKVNASFINHSPVRVLLAKGDGEGAGDDGETVSNRVAGDRGLERGRLRRQVGLLERLPDIIGPHGGNGVGGVFDEDHHVLGNVHGDGLGLEVFGVVGALAHEP